MKDITFVLLTCGEETEKDCVAAIEPFQDQIEFLEVRNVSPQINALNQMIKSVETEYFVALDSDMILYKDSWQRILTAWRKHWRDPNWHSVLFSLWDTLTEKKILALKLMRTRVMKDNLFHDVPTPDVEHFQRLTEQGYTCIQDYMKLRPVGDHVVKGRHFCYHKYKDVYQTYRTHCYSWDDAVFMGGETLQERAKCHFDFFVYKYLQTDNPDYLHCICGMMDGIISPLSGSKDLRETEYKFDRQEGIDAFWDWYFVPKINQSTHQETLLF